MKKAVYYVFAIIVIACLGLFGCSKDNPAATATTGTISGVVTDSASGTAITGAGIVTSPATSSVTANTAGQFSITGVNAGTYTVTASKTGYNSKSVSVAVTAGNTATANIALAAGGTVSIEWVSIPAGNFTMGSLSTDPYAYSDEQPQHTVYLDAYQISKYEITNSQYKAFMDAGGYSNSAYWTTDGWTWKTTNSITEPYYWTAGTYNSGIAFPNYPVIGVSWYEAYAFCNWAGGHLPTEAQWEKAARYTDARYYPWGSTWDSTKCNSSYGFSTYPDAPPDTFTYSSPVDYFTAGQSYYGVYNMAGNVWEWCNDWYDSAYYSDPGATSNPAGPTTGTDRVLRGGSIYVGCIFCRVATRSFYDTPDGRNNSGLGFRPAK